MTEQTVDDLVFDLVVETLGALVSEHRVAAERSIREAFGDQATLDRYVRAFWSSNEGIAADIPYPSDARLQEIADEMPHALQCLFYVGLRHGYALAIAQRGEST